MARTITVRARSTDNVNGLVTERVTTTVVQDAVRFPGDPGTGKTLAGCTALTEASTDSVAWLDANTAGTKKHVVSRVYGFPRSGSASNRGLDRALIAAEIAKGRLVAASTKYLQASPAQIAAGGLDAQIDSDADWMRNLGVPIWNDYFHEPFDDHRAGAPAAAFRAAYRHIVGRYRARGASNVAWFGPASMLPWEYMPGGETSRGGPAYHCDPDWKGTLSGAGGVPNVSDWYSGAESVLDMFAMDQYSPVLGSGSYTSFGAQFALMKAKFTAWKRPVKPFFVPEIGTQDVSPTPDWVAHWADFRAACAANDVVGYCYFNFKNGGGSSLSGEDPTGVRLAAYSAHFQNAAVLGI